MISTWTDNSSSCLGEKPYSPKALRGCGEGTLGATWPYVGLVLELRGDLSQRQFAKKFGVSFSTIHSWESGTSWPGTQNLTRLAQLKGWSFDELQFYLEGEPLPSRLSVPQLLTEVRSLPFEAAAQVAKVALETMANKERRKPVDRV